MAGKELAVKKAGTFDLREIAARAKLREVRLQGHVYVELRQVGKRTIFFCTLCLTQCYNEAVLYDHLRGNLHARRYAAAKVTLFGPVPWPFNDGVFFFDSSPEEGQSLFGSDNCKDLALVRRNGDEVTSGLRRYNGSVDLDLIANDDARILDGSGDNGSVVLGIAANGCDKSSRCSGEGNGHAIVSKFDGSDSCLVIPGVIQKDEVIDLRTRYIGLGHLAFIVHEVDGACSKISKIWCAWLGEGDSDDDSSILASPTCDFGIVVFSYTDDLGRKWTLDELNSVRSPGSGSEVEEGSSPRKRRRRSFSDSEYSSGTLSNTCALSGEDCSGFNNCASNSSKQLQIVGDISSTAARRRLRKQKRLAAERMCDICAQPMLPGRDVATLLNVKTGNLACSSRNTNGAFHLFHASCLIHWILLCEYEIWVDQSVNGKPLSRRRRKVKPVKPTGENHISSILCPECHGTGISIKGDELEKPTISLSQMFLYKLKAIEAHNAWMKSPEVLQKCSTGLHFPSDPVGNLQEKVTPFKLLHFYRADK